MILDSYISAAEKRASTEEMLQWALAHMAAHEPLVLTDSHTDRPYLERWFIVPRNQEMNVYLHRFVASDSDGVLHDHRGDNRSWILFGSCVEHRSRGEDSRVLRAGDVVSRRATDLHRIELTGGPMISLFSIGPIMRDWGFYNLDTGTWTAWAPYIAQKRAERKPE